MDDDDDILTGDVEEKTGCVMCEKVGAIFGIILGTALLFVGIDLLTGGYLSSMISGGKADDE